MRPTKDYVARLYEPARGGPKQHWHEARSTSLAAFRREAKAIAEANGWRLVEVAERPSDWPAPQYQ